MRMASTDPLPIKRREFLRGSIGITAVLGFPLIVPREVLGALGHPGPNDRIQVGFIGLGGRARWILKDEALPGAEVVALTDCNLQRCRDAAKLIPARDRCKHYQNHAEMFEKEKLDAVFVETTTHARVLICIHA